MKVFIVAGEGATQRIRVGYANAMSKIGYKCWVWHPSSNRPIFDIFTEFEPDAVMCGTADIDRPLFKNIMKRPHLKLMLWGGNWGEFDSQIDYKVDTVGRITEAEKQLVPQLVKNNNVSRIITYYHQRWADVTHNYWKNIGLAPLGLPLAADLTEQQPSPPLDELKCDVSFIGGYWPYKAINLNQYVIPLCYPSSGLKVKIFGYGDWPVAQYLGVLENNLLPNLFSSSTININVFEPLASKYGFDVNERCYKIIACGGFCISEACESAEQDIFTDKEVVFAHNPKEMVDKIRYYIRKQDDIERFGYILRGIKSTRQKHNYFIRLRQLLPHAGITVPPSLDKIIEDLQHD